MVNFDARITELETKLQTAKDTYRSVSLEWDVELDKKLSLAGKIRLNSVREGIRDYKAIEYPVAVFGEHNTERSSLPGIFCYPNAIAINTENNFIYICDGGNDRVQVFNKSFEFVFQFNDKINTPAGICIKQDKVYVTQYRSHCLNVYSTEGKFLTSVGVKGRNKLEFYNPKGLDISTDKNRIYLAEYGNDRVQCLNFNLNFNSFIVDVLGAIDVKLTPNEIAVLSARNPCVSLYSYYSHQLIREMIPRGEGKPILIPAFLIFDKSLNILITDYLSHCVSVFSFGGELIDRFGRKGEKRGELLKPRGIAIDIEGRIIVASDNRDYCIQVF